MRLVFFQVQIKSLVTFHVHIQVISTPKGSVADGAFNRDKEVSTFNVLVHVCGFVTEVITVGARPASLSIYSGSNHFLFNHIFQF